MYEVGVWASWILKPSPTTLARTLVRSFEIRPLEISACTNFSKHCDPAYSITTDLLKRPFI